MKSSISIFIIATILLGFGCRKENNPALDTSKYSSPVTKEKWHWDNPAKQSESAGYAQVVKVGNTIYISGVPTTEISPKGITVLYEALRMSLEAFGATPENVVKETLYTTDIEAMKEVNSVRKEFYNGDYPAASWVEVSRLYEAEAKLEVDLIAVLTN